MIILPELYKFDWDKGNSGKNLKKHSVTDTECEEVFFDENKIQFKDILHSNKEERFILLGETKELRLVFVIYTPRDGKIRVVSARDVNKKERKRNEEKS